MSKGETVLYTVCYPQVLPYVDEFFCSLVNQTDQDFDVFVLNDACGSLNECFKRYPSLRIEELAVSGSFAQIRQFGFDAILANGYKQVVFGDMDDRFNPLRIERMRALLCKWDVVVHDVNLFGDLELNGYFSRRIIDGKCVSIEDILSYNFMGFTNTAVRSECLKEIVLEEVTAIDWFLFSCLIAEGSKTVFCGESLTDYRRYQGNIACLGDNQERTRQVKHEHYTAIRKKYPYLASRIDCVWGEGRHNNSRENINRDIKYPFWWEE